MIEDVADSDDALLRAFVGKRDAAAFRRIVERYTPLVYAAARRQVRDAHLAEDVTQAVFLLLARKAGRVAGGAALAGWLINTSRLAARDAVRSDVRRKIRERRAGELNTTSENATMADAKTTIEESVDHALCRLGEQDRTAVTLRYLQGMSRSEIARVMGVSEEAAGKRLTRAVAKLRKFFARRPEVLGLSPLAFGETLLAPLRHSAFQPPPHLASAAAEAALNPAGAAARASLAADVIVRAVGWTMFWRNARIAAVASVAGLLLMAGAAATVVHSRGDGRSASSQQTSSAKGPIKVGVYVSAATALPKPPEANAWFQQFRIVDELKSVDGIQLIPVVEPGHDNQPQQKRLLRYYFADTPPLDVMDPAALGQLDVIVVSGVHFAPHAALTSLETAVKSGTGLYVRGCLGGCEPGFDDPVVARLRGMAEGMNVVASAPQACEILGEHPILGTLARGQTIMLQPAGGTGVRPGPSYVPLIRLKSTDALADADGKPLPKAVTFPGDVLHVGSLGEGRIVALNCNATTPPPLQEATGNRFLVRVVQWLADRPVN